MIFNQTEENEKLYLKQIISNLEHTLNGIDSIISNQSKEILDFKTYLWENAAELDHAEKNAVRESVTQSVVSGESVVAKKKRISKLIDSPYFGRIDFQENQANKQVPIYIGIHSFFDTELNQNLIHDWRAPISSMFYDYELGQAQFEAPSGMVSGMIQLKRQYRIRKSVMEFMLESSLNIHDEVLQEELSNNSDDRMKNIVSTIQREQNQIIRNDKSQSLIIQGVAGSGKTSIALHRVAFLLYKFAGQITSKEILIISPNKVFADYISNVLPELGEEKIMESGFEELLTKLMEGKYKFQTFFEQVTEILEHPDQNYLERIQFKATHELISRLEQFVVYTENNYFEASDVLIGKIPIPASYIHEKFRNFHRLPIRQRFDAIARDIVQEVMLTTGIEFRAPEINKLKAGIRKMFKETNDIKLYKAFYDWLGRPGLFKIRRGSILEYADLAPLLYLKMLLDGPKVMNEVKHLLVDEMQDYTPIQYKVLSKVFPCKKTILGDASQSVNPYTSTSFKEIAKVLSGADVMKLCKSYRSTYEITNFAQHICPNDELIAIERHGEEPGVFVLDNEEEEAGQIAYLIKGFLLSANKSMGIVCKTQLQASELYEQLKNVTPQLYLLTSESAAFVNGVVITTAHMAKGLEFDEVIVPKVNKMNFHTRMDQSLLYIACTRAMHKLSITAWGALSNFIIQ